MVDKRLEDVHTSQMTESAVNVEFLDAIKKHGPNIITLIALIVIVFWAYGRFNDYMEARKGEAWISLVEADSYGSLVGIGDDSRSIGSLSQFAWNAATEMRWQELMIGKSLTWTPDISEDNETDDITNEPQTAPPMSFPERYEALDDIKSLYIKVIDKCGKDSNLNLYLIKSQFGLASVAEMRGRYEAAELIENNLNENEGNQDDTVDTEVSEILTRYQEEAAELYREIETLAGDTYPVLSELAVARRESLVNIKPFKLLPTEDEIKTAKEPPVENKAEADTETVSQPVFDAQSILDSLPVPDSGADGSNEKEDTAGGKEEKAADNDDSGGGSNNGGGI